MEEKYGKQRPDSERPASRVAAALDNDRDTESSTDSEDEDEDDEGILVSEALDAQIDATLKAIRTKDPRVYDQKSTFYVDDDEKPHGDMGNTERKDKPMYLSDYHRRNLLDGFIGQEEDSEKPMTYAQEQEDLKSSIVREMHATTNGFGRKVNGIVEGSDEEDEFLVRKPSEPDVELSKAPVKELDLNVEAADNDPETYLSNFMAARAWIPSAGSQFQPFESDDEDEDRRAEAFEEAYNLRFENPNSANEKLVSHARDAAVKYSVRKEEVNNRKKARDSDRAKKEAEKRDREDEKARLRKLRISEVEEKVEKIKQAAGLGGKSISAEDWAAFIDEGWDDDRWNEEMKRRFGDDYYAGQDLGEVGSNRSKTKVKKPKWKDDIDIRDLVPDFESENGIPDARFNLSDTEGEDQAGYIEEEASETFDGVSTSKTQVRSNVKHNTKRRRDEHKKEARKDRRIIERLVDEKLETENKLSGIGGKKAGYFRYRETSPLAFGLTPRDILMASDSQLNQYAGLKKMATFRDGTKKRKDKKHLGKKARLRDWRKETFGNEDGPQLSLAELYTEKGAADSLQKHTAQSHANLNGSKKQRGESSKGKANKSRSSA